jgi:ATP-binding protein involved in chromosome partitioning
VENMSTFVCPHCNQATAIFGDAGGQKLAEEYGVPLLARLPLDPETRVGGDEGMPITVRRPDSAPARAFRELAVTVNQRLDALGQLGTLPKIS